MENKNELLSIEDIRSLVYIIRGQQVMLDSDLAEIYGYEVRRLNEQVKRNINRFPEDFMFQLSVDEIEMVKAQIAESLSDNLKSQFATSSWGGKRKAPFAFTEQGIYMLATVLRGELAEQQSIFIMRAFKEMRHYIKQNQQFVTQSEMNLVTARVAEMAVKVAGVMDQQKKADKSIADIQKSIDSLNANFISDKDYRNFVVYMGKIAYGRRKTEKKLGARNETHVVEQPDYPIYEGRHEAIIPEDDWNIAQAKRKKTANRRTITSKNNHVSILSIQPLVEKDYLNELFLYLVFIDKMKTSNTEGDQICIQSAKR